MTDKYLVFKKKLCIEFRLQKKTLHKQWAQKKLLQAENPPITFLIVDPLSNHCTFADFIDRGKIVHYSLGFWIPWCGLQIHRMDQDSTLVGSGF